MTTLHSVNMNPTALMRCYDPVDGLEYTFFGDSIGNLYKMESDNTDGGDGSVNDIRTSRKSALIRMPVDTEAFGISGWVKYRKPSEDITLKLKFEFQGHHIYTHEIEQTLFAPTDRNYWNGGSYYSNGQYFGSTIGKIGHEIIGIPGKSTEFQVTATIEGKTDFSISEIGLRFEIAS